MNILHDCDEKSEVKIEHWNSTISPFDEVIDYSKELNMVYMLYVKLALIELALLNLMISLDPLRVLRTLRYTPRRGWNGSYASNISIVINDNDYID